MKKMTSRDLQAAERRQQLLEAAKELFAEQGYHATSIRSITKKIGMADGLIYHYFPGGKLEMLQTIVVESHESRLNMMEQISSKIPDDISVRQLLLLFLGKLHEFLFSDPHMLRILTRERDLLSLEQAEYLSNRIRQRRDWVANFLRQRAAAGEIREMDFEMAAIQVISINFAAFAQHVARIDLVDGDYHAFIERMVDYVMSQWQR